MKTKNRLFELIKSMSKNEKGYFKKYSQLHSSAANHKYNSLFTLIDDQVIYDEKELKKKLKDQKLVLNLPEAKYYLQKQLLRSLQIFHQGSTVDIQLIDYLNQINILFSKALHAHCLSLIQKARTLAEKFEKHSYALAFLKIERDIFKVMPPPFDHVNSLGHNFSKEKSIIKKLSYRNKFQTVSEKIYGQYRYSGPAKSKQELELAKSRIQKVEKLNESNKTSFDLQLTIYSGYHAYYNFIGNLKESSKQSVKALTLFNKHQYRLEDKYTLRNYFLLLNQSIVASARLGHLDDVEQTLSNFRSTYENLRAKHLTQDIKLRYFEIYYVHKLDLFIRKKSFSKGISFIALENLESSYSKYRNLLDGSYSIVLLNNIACIYMGDGSYQKALYWFNRITIENLQNYRQDIYCIVKIYELVLHYELGNFDLLQSRMRSAYRFFQKKNKLLKFEKNILSFMRQLPNELMNRKEQVSAFSKLRRQLQPLTKEPIEKEFFSDFDFIEWLDKKIG